jgi:hypothetical protein
MEVFRDALKKEGIDAKLADIIADNLSMDLENYLLEQKLKDKNYQPNAEEIKEFVENKLSKGNLVLEQGSSDAYEMDGTRYKTGK